MKAVIRLRSNRTLSVRSGADYHTPNVLRRTLAVSAVQKGISLPTLQRLLGHDHLTTTEIYLNLSPEEVVREFQSKW